MDLRFRVLADYRPGACCSLSGCIDNVEPDRCEEYWGGIHTGTGSLCSMGACDTGVCCDQIWGQCSILLPQQCYELGADWYFEGRNTTCLEERCEFRTYGACCHGEVCSDNNYMSLGKCEEEGGVWAGPNTLCRDNPCPPCRFGDGDLDFDADLDMRDFAILQSCFGKRAAGDCLCADFNGDSYLDIRDAALFVHLSERWPFPETIPPP